MSEVQQLFPPPPPFYKLYREDADGSAQRPLPPEPPAPVEGTYAMFGELYTTEGGLPPLAVRRLYETQPDGSIDFKEQLLALHRELTAGFLELLAVLADRPSAYARQVEALGLVLRNFHHLANQLRPHQAGATLAARLRSEAEDRERAAAELRAAAAAGDAALRAAADGLEVLQGALQGGGGQPPAAAP